MNITLALRWVQIANRVLFVLDLALIDVLAHFLHFLGAAGRAVLEPVANCMLSKVAFPRFDFACMPS